LSFSYTASESRHKGSNAPYVRSLVVDEERMRLYHWIWLLFCSLQCFDIVGWVTGKTSSMQTTCATYLHRFFSRTSAARKSRENHPIQDHLKNGLNRTR